MTRLFRVIDIEGREDYVVVIDPESHDTRRALNAILVAWRQRPTIAEIQLRRDYAVDYNTSPTVLRVFRDDARVEDSWGL